SSEFLFGRVNFLERYRPGVDIAVTKPNSYGLSMDVVVGTGGKPKDFFELPAIFTYGLADKIESGISLGIVSYASETGISDLSLGCKYVFPIDIGVEFGFSFPTADYKKGLGTGGIGIIIDWFAKKKLDKLFGHILLGYRINTENPEDLKYGNEFLYTLGVEYPTKKNIDFFGELKGINHAPLVVDNKNIKGSSYNELYIAPGLRYTADKNFDFYSSLLFGLTEDSRDVIFSIGLDFKF
ncbi:MAG: transporter, partial [Endomicrobiia bacterium]